jgi:hypothetical protein
MSHYFYLFFTGLFSLLNPIANVTAQEERAPTTVAKSSCRPIMERLLVPKNISAINRMIIVRANPAVIAPIRSPGFRLEKRLAITATTIPIKKRTLRKEGSVKFKFRDETVQIGIPAEIVARIVMINLADCEFIINHPRFIEHSRYCRSRNIFQ